MTDQPIGPRCGNNPNVQLTDGDRKAVDDFKARLALQAAVKPYIERAVWEDGDPLMEVIAATIWGHCARDDEDMTQLVRDDPRTIAAFAAAVARAHAAAVAAPGTAAEPVCKFDEGCHRVVPCEPGCGAAEPVTQAADVASCSGYETSPNLCRCPCYGCKHHCSAHDPEEVPDAEPAATQAALRQPAYDAVFAWLRKQPVDFLPVTVVGRNAMIWHAVHAALDAVLPADSGRADTLREAAERVARHLAAKDHPSIYWIDLTESAQAAYLADADAILAVLGQVEDDEGMSGPCDCGEGAVHYTDAECPAERRRMAAEPAATDSASDRRVYAWAQTIDTADRGQTVHIPGVHHTGHGPEKAAVTVSRADIPVLLAMLADTEPAATTAADTGGGCGPAPDQCDAEAGEPCANHEREQAHTEGERCFCGPECDKACTCGSAGDAFVPLGHYRDCPAADVEPAAGLPAGGTPQNGAQQ
jgi:hypothetical protein